MFGCERGFDFFQGHGCAGQEQNVLLGEIATLRGRLQSNPKAETTSRHVLGSNSVETSSPLESQDSFPDEIKDTNIQPNQGTSGATLFQKSDALSNERLDR